MKDTILVTGATGNLGKCLVKAATAKGFRVKAAARHPEKVPAAMNVQAVKMDYMDPRSIDMALDGITRVFLVAPPLDPEAANKLKPLIEKASLLGVEQIVFVSAFGVDRNEQAPLRIIERMLKDAGIRCTILRPNFFMENFSTGFAASMIKTHGGIFVAAGEGKTSFISATDIAEIAGTAFAKNLAGEEYNLTGPAALDHAEVARIISAVLGRNIQYHALSEEAMFQGARNHGMPEEAVRYLGVLYSAVRSGYMAQITSDVKKVTGKEPMTFEAFVRANSSAWK